MSSRDCDEQQQEVGTHDEMELVLNDPSNPEEAAALRATLEREYATITMPDWDKRQIEKQLGK